MDKTPALILIIFFLVALPAAAASTIHVPADQPTIQAGIDAALDLDIVLVADGTYTGEGNREIDFGGKSVILKSVNGRDHCIIDLEGHWGFQLDSGESQLTIIQGFTVVNGSRTIPPGSGGAIYCGDASPVILLNSFINNISPGDSGGAIACGNSTQVIGNYFSGNWCDDDGGALSTTGGTPLVLDNVFFENEAFLLGGAIGCYGGSPRITNNLIVGNRQDWQGNDIGGGGIACLSGSTPIISNCTLADNHAEGNNGGGGLFVDDSSDITCENCVLWNNTGAGGLEQIGGLFGGTVLVEYSDVMGGWAGTGNIDLDPLFATGPDGEHYLSQIAAGQAKESPCVDAGGKAHALLEGTTRTDHVPDEGIADMGFHYQLPVHRIRLVAGPGPGYDNPPLVRVFFPIHENPFEYEFSAYGAPHYGVNVTCGDVDGDAIDEILTGPGPGEIYGPHVRGFGRDGEPVPGLNFLAYGTNRFGVNVTAGDLDGDGAEEIITGAGPGAVFGPHVRGWTYGGPSGVTAYTGVSYFAYGTPKWGVKVACGDIDGDGYDEIVTGAGPGAVYGPHVRGWDVDGEPSVSAIPGVSYFAYNTLKYGVNVSCGDVNGDGIDEIITGAGPGAVFGPHVRGWKYDNGSVDPMPGLNFFAWDTAPLSFGVNVDAGTDFDGDGRAELLVGRGPDPAADTQVKAFSYEGRSVHYWTSFIAFPDLTYGTNVAAGRF